MVLVAGEGADELFGGYWQLSRGVFLDFLPWRARSYNLEAAARLTPLKLLPAWGRESGRKRASSSVPSLPRVESDDIPAAELAFDQAVAETAAAAYRHRSGARTALEVE